MNLDRDKGPNTSSEKSDMQSVLSSVVSALKGALFSESTPSIVSTKILHDFRGSLIISKENDAEKSERTKKKVISPSPKVYVKILNPSKFAKIREARHVTNVAFIEELSKPIQVLGKLGKSGSKLAFTASQQFVIKTLSKNEANHLRKVLPEILDYICKNNRSGDDVPSERRTNGMYTAQTLCLCQVIFTNTKLKAISKKIPNKVIYIAIQESCYPSVPHPINKPLIFDLKGSWVNRTTKLHSSSSQSQTSATSTSTLAPEPQIATANTPPEAFPPHGVILKDNNLKNILDQDSNWIEFVSHTHSTSLVTREDGSIELVEKTHKSDVLDRVFFSLLKDAYFLAKCNCLDYSLLLVIIPVSSETRQEVERDHIRAPPLEVKINGVLHFAYMRIIDTLCPWNVKKQIARAYKSILQQKSRSGLSTCPPDMYAKRFVKMCEDLLKRPQQAR